MRWGKRLLTALLLYISYVFVFGILVFRLPDAFEPSAHHYDVSLLNQADDNADYVSLLEDSTEAFHTRLTLIENAETTIDMSALYALSGPSRDILFGALLEAAERGVTVRLTFNGIRGYGNLSIRDFTTLNAHDRISIKNYEPFNPFLPYTLQNGIHDKLLIVDGNHGIIGGRNIDDRYFLPEQSRRREVLDREVYLFTDAHSAALSDMQRYFDRMFHEYYARPISSRQHASNQQRLLNAYQDYRNTEDIASTYATVIDEAILTDRVTFVHSPLTRGKKEPVIFNTLSELADQYDRWFVQTTAFGFTREMIEGLPNIEERSITLMTNNLAQSPNPWGTAGYLTIRSQLNAHATIYEHQTDKTIHAKSMRFGDEITVVGSYNLNPRSTFHNSESVVVIYSEAFAAHFDEQISHLFDDALKLDEHGDYIDGPVEPVPLSVPRRILIYTLRAVAEVFDFML